MAFQQAHADQVPVIMTDATCDLPSEYIKHYAIGVIPHYIHINDRMITSDAAAVLPELVEKHNAYPTISALSITHMRSVFQQASASGRPILAIVLSSKMSRTFEHAQAAARGLNDSATIAIVDSKTTAGELGLQVLTAARAAQAGYTIADILPLLRKTYINSTLLFCQDDLAFLEHSDRMGLVSYRVAQTLGLKPIITVSKHGDSAGMYVANNERPRSLREALDSFERGIAHVANPRDPLRVLIAYGDPTSAALADMLSARLLKRFEHAEIETFLASPINLATTGPRTVSVAFATGGWPV